MHAWGSVAIGTRLLTSPRLCVCRLCVRVSASVRLSVCVRLCVCASVRVSACVHLRVRAEPVWLTGADDSMGSEADLRVLAEWDHEKLEALLLRAAPRPSPEQLTAAELIRHLLDPSPHARMMHFAEGGHNAEMKLVLKHPFFLGHTLDDATLKENQVRRGACPTSPDEL